MTNTQITAKFKGEPGSLGFKHGEPYNLGIVFHCSGKVSITHERPGTIIGYQPCEYSNFKTFLDNWEEITNLKR